MKQGYLLGNPVTDSFIDVSSRISYVHKVNLISDADIEHYYNLIVAGSKIELQW